MTVYIAFLRGINVSGTKKVPMAQLRSLLEENGLDKVTTYIQSGNVVFSSLEEDKSVLENKIQETIEKEFGFQVPVLVITKTGLDTILTSNPFEKNLEKDNGKIYYVLLKNKPDSMLVKHLEEEVYENEEFYVTDTCVYLQCNTGYGKAKLNNNLIERKLKVEATTRNHRTMEKLGQMAANLN
ncbi:DUF1697 domain-containing protein [Euzebyella saccharophila]|uniref:DUF1697 domain-containing protein n=1 Tax=Euzebyella saccharophila TaxID=679664 RepID=A0ABV8JKW3_9FLAO|nr:DUF1697 domain-containing protein [Euzebyella saccharophila]